MSKNRKARAMEVEIEKIEKINSLEDLVPFLSKQDNTINTVYFADVPEICLKEPCMLGVDEAGRGPVLGPMVYGIAFCPIEKSEILKDLGCADSKQLTEENREHIFNEITTKEVPKSNLGWAVEVISPNYISNCMYRRTKHSLNEVSMNSAIGLIQQAFDLNANITEIYVDTVGPPEKYQAKLEAIFPKIKITVAKKADSTYPIVSAASICAKVTRDHALKAWKFPEGLDLTHENFGSGYPGDPVTKSFLQENIDPVFGFPRLVRFSWSTSETILNSKAYPLQFNEDEEIQIESNSKSVQITSFFNKYSKTGVKQRERHAYFKNRFLDNVTDL